MGPNRYNYKHLFTILVWILVSSLSYVESQGKTRVGFYSRSCPRAETIVSSTVESHFGKDATVGAGLLRLHFHDCFVEGCDASVLISGPGSERTAGANVRLHGFDVIDDAKTQIEAACPGVVSCADILALAARDALVLSGAQSWQVPTGRRDGKISLASNVDNLPSPSDSVDVQKQKFAAFGLNTQDLVTLVGGHTIGTSVCQFFSYRLYNFTTTTPTGADPSMDPAFVSQLRALCPENGDGSREVSLDTATPTKFDVSFFDNLRNGRGILESDQKLWTDASTKTFVSRYLNVRGLQALSFNLEFGKSMIKMGNIGVKTGSDGEIRRVCSSIN